jgi:hypothetical protein
MWCHPPQCTVMSGRHETGEGQCILTGSRQHHHRRQAMTGQKSDPLDNGLEACLKPRKLLPMISIACWSSSGKHQAIMGVDLHNRLVLPPMVPLAGTNRHNISSRSLGSELEIVGADRVHPLPGPTQYVEQPEEGNRWPQAGLTSCW